MTAVASTQDLTAQIGSLLNSLGQGQVLSVSYDTSWLARLSLKLPGQGFDFAFDWLLNHQHPDGSWGAGVPHAHDHVICTLAAVIALRLTLNPIHDSAIQRGIHYVWRAINTLHADANDTINFRGIISLLLSEARDLGLDVPADVYYKHDRQGSKLAALSVQPEIWRTHPISHSLECFHPSLPSAITVINPNGSVGVSPAASAAVLLNSSDSHPDILRYLHNAALPDGGYPTVSPIDIFEVTWSLNVLRRSGAITKDHHNGVYDCLEHVWQHWDPTRGIGYSTQFHSYNLDDTATAYMVLRWADYPVTLDPFASYELDTHFLTFPNETDPSLSAHLRLLMILKDEPPQGRTRRWIAKILDFLRQHAATNQIWNDKWHASPLYLRSLAAIALHNLNNSLALQHLAWLSHNQNPDGGWGYYQRSTPEETAYALDALLYWSRHGQSNPALIAGGIDYLSAHQHDPPTELWVGKCLYYPPKVVQSAILATLFAYKIYQTEVL